MEVKKVGSTWFKGIDYLRSVRWIARMKSLPKDLYRIHFHETRRDGIKQPVRLFRFAKFHAIRQSEYSGEENAERERELVKLVE
jgi:hypothetical protein